MKDDDCRQIKMEQNDMQVILKFPKKSKNDENIKREVKDILSNILREQLINIL